MLSTGRESFAPRRKMLSLSTAAAKLQHERIEVSAINATNAILHLRLIACLPLNGGQGRNSCIVASRISASFFASLFQKGQSPIGAASTKLSSRSISPLYLILSMFPKRP